MHLKKFLPALCFLAISIFVLFLNHFPDYYAATKTPPGMSFSGQASWFDPWDINVYVAAINWGQSHGLLLENTYTTTQHQPVLIYPLYTLTGSLFPNVSPFLLFHLSAILLGVILLLVLLKLSQTFLRFRIDQLIAVLLISLGGGVGWLTFPNFPSSDLFMTGFTFSSHFQRSHEALGIILYLLSLVLFYKSTERNDRRLIIFSAASSAFLMLFYPFYLLSVALICGLYALVIYFRDGKKYPFVTLLFSLIPASVIAMFYVKHLLGNQGFSGVLSQDLSKQGILQILSGYGILVFPVIIQIFKKPRGKTLLFLNLWLFTSIALSFLPFGFARFYLRALFFPLVMISLLVISQFPKKTLLTVALIAVVPLSAFYMSYKRINEVGGDNLWYYLTNQEREAVDFLSMNAVRGSGVLAGYTIGNYIPANTDSRVYFGHLLQTPQSEQKIQNILNFYAQLMTEDQAREFLKKENITYIIWGDEEKGISQNYSQRDKLEYSFLSPAFSGDQISIFAKY